jgi:hypothetical protein
MDARDGGVITNNDRRAMEPVRQLGTHRKLVSQTEQQKIDRRLALDAIVVPASRSVGNLETAITLARAARSALIILCSHHATAADAHQILASRSFDHALVIDLPDNYSHELLEFRALASIKNELPSACSYYRTNLSTKRNLGLLLALMVGWRRIFFLDDDIRDIGFPDLQSTVAMLARYRTAGMRVTHFPDNSAACHAHRATGGMQDVFLSGSALAVDMQREIGFFPHIYNEDWLFFYDDVASGQLGNSARRITQLHYDPFADPQRAAWQEFGDVLAEGLYALLDRGLGVKHATREYWDDFLHARQTFLRAILRRADTAKWEMKDQILLSIKAALECSVTIEPRTLERYIQLWRRDLGHWQQQVAAIGDIYPLKIALRDLGLEESAYGRAADVAHLRQGFDPEEVPTTPYELRDLFDLLGCGAAEDDLNFPNLRKPRRSRREGIIPHHGSPKVRQGGIVAATRRGFRLPGRA